jgi:hypothetical protein
MISFKQTSFEKWCADVVSASEKVDGHRQTRLQTCQIFAGVMMARRPPSGSSIPVAASKENR